MTQDTVSSDLSSQSEDSNTEEFTGKVHPIRPIRPRTIGQLSENLPDNFDPQQLIENLPDGFERPFGDGELSEDFDPQELIENLPEGFERPFGDGERPELPDNFDPQQLIENLPEGLGERFAEGERPELPDDFDPQQLIENLPEDFERPGLGERPKFDELIGRLDSDYFSNGEINDTLLFNRDGIEDINSLFDELAIPQASELGLTPEDGMFAFPIALQMLSGEGDITGLPEELTLPSEDFTLL